LLATIEIETVVESDFATLMVFSDALKLLRVLIEEREKSLDVIRVYCTRVLAIKEKTCKESDYYACSPQDVVIDEYACAYEERSAHSYYCY
jgi:hypothetical protein